MDHSLKLFSQTAKLLSHMPVEIMNKAMGPHCHQYIVEHCKNHPFSLGIDGSSDTDVKKINPVTIKLLDMDKSKCVTNHFYDVCHNRL